jgi:hypothetical protein
VQTAGDCCAGKLQDLNDLKRWLSELSSKVVPIHGSNGAPRNAVFPPRSASCAVFTTVSQGSFVNQPTGPLSRRASSINCDLQLPDLTLHTLPKAPWRPPTPPLKLPTPSTLKAVKMTSNQAAGSSLGNSCCSTPCSLFDQVGPSQPTTPFPYHPSPPPWSTSSESHPVSISGTTRSSSPMSNSIATFGNTQRPPRSRAVSLCTSPRSRSSTPPLPFASSLPLTAAMHSSRWSESAVLQSACDFHPVVGPVSGARLRFCRDKSVQLLRSRSGESTN